MRHPEVGVCGLSCRLCPSYLRETGSRCGGCKSEGRMAAGCPFITCAVKNRGIEFCWDCGEGDTCDRWREHREHGKRYDSFKCYQTLESDISAIQGGGLEAWIELQKVREQILREMLDGYDSGRSKTHYCIAATVMEIDELRETLAGAGERSEGLDVRSRSRVLRGRLDAVALARGYCLRLRRRVDDES